MFDLLAMGIGTDFSNPSAIYICYIALGGKKGKNLVWDNI